MSNHNWTQAIYWLTIIDDLNKETRFIRSAIAVNNLEMTDLIIKRSDLTYQSDEYNIVNRRLKTVIGSNIISKTEIDHNDSQVEIARYNLNIVQSGHIFKVSA